MKLPIFAACGLALALGGGYAMADTASSEKDRATMEHKASPSNSAKQDEERAGAHSQPDTPTSSGGSAAESASSGSSSAAGADSSGAPATAAKPTMGEYYQSNENKADSTAKPPAPPEK